MKLLRYISTLIHLKPEQIFFQALEHIHTHKFKLYESPSQTYILQVTRPIPKHKSYQDGHFCFLNISSKFNGWDDDTYGPLWTYNLNYMDWIQQLDISPDECALWIDRFIQDSANNKIGFAPYPTSLRCINWIKFFSNNPDYATQNRLDHLYSQLVLLSISTERNIGGNHLLENASAMIIGASFFKDKRMANSGKRLMKREIKRQILPDGAHFEQSPMYHCVILERILDCINYTISDSAGLLFRDEIHDYLINSAKAMIGHLKNIVWDDGTIPLTNDSALGIAPDSTHLLDYAHRLGIDSEAISMKECGYRRLRTDRMNMLADVGNITATFQPGHSHADTFSYELRIDGKPFIVDTGISTYQKDERRQYERGTEAHNTVVLDGRDSSEVWSGFRVGRRAQVTIKTDTDSIIEACHNGFGRNHIHHRIFRAVQDCIEIQDIVTGAGGTVSLIHFAPDVVVKEYDSTHILTDRAQITFSGATDIRIIQEQASTEYNRLKAVYVSKISFTSKLEYRITAL